MARHGPGHRPSTGPGRGAKPAVPKGYEKGDTSYKLTAETYYYPKPTRADRPPSKPGKPAPMPVKVVGPVSVKGKGKGK